MGKKKFRKPQIRKRIKPTTGKLELVDVIYIDKERTPDPDNPKRKKEHFFGTCTCKQWRSSKEATTLKKIGEEAKQHVEESGHQLRKHDVIDEGDDEGAGAGSDQVEQGDAGSDDVGDES